MFVLFLQSKYRFLFNFCPTAEFSCKVEIFEQGGLEPIIKLLSSTDCDVQVRTLSNVNISSRNTVTQLTIIHYLRIENMLCVSIKLW